MTLVIAVHNRRCLWVVADRRLSYADGRPPIDNAIKLMSLQTEDGFGVLAYAGLGMTARGTQPSEWLRSVFLGRTGRFEAGLQMLAEIAVAELPRHLRNLPDAGHVIIAEAFVDGEPRRYTITTYIDPVTGDPAVEFARLTIFGTPDSPVHRLALAGSGGYYLEAHADGWDRRLLHLVRAHERGRVDTVAVADHLAVINHRVHQQLRDGTVGPDCIVAWQYRDGTGESQFYAGVTRTNREDDEDVPEIADGGDIPAIGRILHDEVTRLTANEVGTPVPNDLGMELTLYDTPADQIHRRINELPHKPDDRLR